MPENATLVDLDEEIARSRLFVKLLADRLEDELDPGGPDIDHERVREFANGLVDELRRLERLLDER